MPPTIAIIKDNDMTDRVVEIAINAGFAPGNILIAKNQAAALALIQELIPDIAVVDPHLTNDDDFEDGLEVIGTLRKMADEQQKRCHIICLTTGGSIDLGVRAYRKGADDYVDGGRAYVNGWEDLKARLKIALGVRRAEQNS